MFELRQNQINAINISKENDFKSGIHYHATGTGKSWIAMYVLKEFNLKYPNKNVLWICERKDILEQQFSKETINNRGFKEIIKKYNVCDFVNNKASNWYEALNSASYWGKPFLCIINRCFLTNKMRYTNIKCKIDLIIHDECHSIENKTTKEFYDWVLSINNSNAKIIGFSATPEKIKPLDTILSNYSIYKGFLDKVILPPKIIWIKSENKIEEPHLITIIKKEIDKLPYKKIIIWCGMIDECIILATKWEHYFKDYTICCDFNNIKKNKFKNYNNFYNSKEKALLFCAVKHREGSDIPNLDGCIFMDHVEKRSERVFIQCMGRVLRKDILNKKKYGLVIDLKAKSTINVCNRVQYYLKLHDIFPWIYNLQNITMNDNVYYINSLDMIEGEKKIIPTELFKTDYTKEEILSVLNRTMPDNKIYRKRLDREINIIIKKKLFGNIVRALEILDITQKIPHITRGSCGSSLLCYLLGISHVDPIKYNISFARFINKFRDNLPDIDFDFPHYLRDEVFLKLYQKWGNHVARISNHIYYHEKSALRESLRQNGINKFISKYDLQNTINDFDDELQNKIFRTQKNLEGTFRGYSLHCGGIVYFPKGIPESYILDKNNSSILNQVVLNKEDVSKNKNFKIDILSSRGLSQLYYCNRLNTINFDTHLGDLKTIELLCNGDNIGITLAETPLMRKALKLIKPKTIKDLAICLSIIRPAAKDTKKEFELGNFNKDNIIFDDDVIMLLSKLMNCDEELADKFRRGYCKGDSVSISLINMYLSRQSKERQIKVNKILKNLKKYGFCKAHALSYAQLVWQLAYQKANHPQIFWKSTLKNVVSCYRKWVHLYEAKCVGITTDCIKLNKSIYAKNRGKKIEKKTIKLEQLKSYGYWIMDNDIFYPTCYGFIKNDYYIFKGLIASSRIIHCGKNKKLLLFVGIDKHKYIEIIINGYFDYDNRKVIVKGKGIIKQSIECESNDISFI